MNRCIFQFFYFLFLILTFSNIIWCEPSEFFTKQIFINNQPCFCYGKIEKTFIESDLNLIFKNFDLVVYDVIKYLNYDNTNFPQNHPNSHFNLMLNLQHINLNYYYSVPFSHNKVITCPQYYEYLYNKDLIRNNKLQYWRPFLSVNQPRLVKIENFNLNIYSYMEVTDLKFKLYWMFKFYLK